jgi:hypothetical protein
LGVNQGCGNSATYLKLPRQDSTDCGNNGILEAGCESTPKNTPPTFAALFAECIREHLTEGQRQTLVKELQAPVEKNASSAD